MGFEPQKVQSVACRRTHYATCRHDYQVFRTQYTLPIINIIKQIIRTTLSRDHKNIIKQIIRTTLSRDHKKADTC